MKLIFLIIGMLLTACGTGPTQSHGGPVKDQVSLIDTLRKDVTVDIVSSVTQPFLHPASGTAVRLSGGSLATPADVQLFEYGSPDAAASDVKSATTNVAWLAPPHFFLKGRVLAIYVGRDPAAVSLLAGAMGPQLAGR